MTKKLLCRLIRPFLLTLTLLLPQLAVAEDVTVNGINYSVNPYEHTASVSSNSGIDGDVVIPAAITYNGTDYSVTEIDRGAFSGCSGMKSVTIGNSVTLIGPRAFSGCSGLTSVTIPNSVTLIGGAAFSGCSGLTSVTIPNSATSIYNDAFSGCSGLTSVTIPNSVTEIYDDAFSGCSGLTSVTIPNSVTSIGPRAFYGCSGLTKAEFASIESLCKIKFSDWSSNPLYYAHHLYIGGKEVKALIIPSSVPKIGNYAFSGCTGLTSVTIGNSVTEIGWWAFFGCSGLASVTIPNSVTEIGWSAFSDCSGLTSVTIGNSVTLIGGAAFSGCSGLTSVTIPNSVTSIGSAAFSGCSGLTSVTIPNSVIEIDSEVFSGCSGLKSVTIGNSVTSIGPWAFSGCSGLTSVTIPNSVTSIGNYAFTGVNLSEVISGAIVPPSIGDDTFSAETYHSATLRVPIISIASYYSRWSRFRILQPVAADILERAYVVDKPGDLINLVSTAEAEKITTLKLSGKLNGTDLLCLNKMVNLFLLDLSEATIVSGGMPYYEKDNERFGTIDDTLGDNWSYNLPLLYYVKLPENLKVIGNSAFKGKRNLSAINIPAGVTSLDNSTFAGCRSLTNLGIENGTEQLSIGSSAFKDCPISTLYLGRNLSYNSDIDDEPHSPFYGKSTLTNLTIGNSVTSIGQWAFSGCSGLTSVTIPDSVTSIGESAFGNCSGLKSVTIPNSVTAIGSSVFRGCGGLTSVAIPNSVTSIGSSAFEDCTGLESIAVPDPLTSLASRVFAQCTRLREITLPGSMREISADAFEGCRAVRVVYAINPIPAVVESTTFAPFANNATLKVPDGSHGIYWIHPYWGKFKEITTWNTEVKEDFVADNITYHITSEADATVEVSAVALSTAQSRSESPVTIEIPKEVVIRDKTYRVAGVANNGFENVAADAVVLPATIGYVGIEAFAGCTRLQSICIKATLPPSVNDNSFDEATYAQASLTVPAEALTAYLTHSIWSKFEGLGIMPTQVTEIVLDATTLELAEGQTATITATVYPDDAANKTLTWTSSDETVATVEANGKVTARKAGECVITARATDGSGVTASCSCTVTAPQGGIEELIADGEELLDVYSIDGRLMRRRCDRDELRTLPRGIYLVNGRKVLL